MAFKVFVSVREVDSEGELLQAPETSKQRETSSKSFDHEQACDLYEDIIETFDVDFDEEDDSEEEDGDVAETPQEENA